MSINQQRRSLFRRTQNDSVIRLPWLKNDLVFTDSCTRCGECEKACPEQIIKQGDGGFPFIDFSIAECSFCQECVKSCKEDLFDLTKESAWEHKATVKDTCLNNQSVYCRSCAESCETEALEFNFTTTTMVTPNVVAEDCTGCGACVSICPSQAIEIK